MPAAKRYDEETQARAVGMYADRLAEGDVSQSKAREGVGAVLGIKPWTLRNWIRRDLEDSPTGTARTAAAEEELAELGGENAQLRRANEILRTASAFFASAEPVRKHRR